MYLCVEYKKRCTIQPTGIYILAAYLLSYWFSSRRWEFYNRFVKLFLLIFSILMPIWCPIWKLRILFFPRVIIVSNNRYIYIYWNTCVYVTSCISMHRVSSKTIDTPVSSHIRYYSPPWIVVYRARVPVVESGLLVHTKLVPIPD